MNHREFTWVVEESFKRSRVQHDSYAMRSAHSSGRARWFGACGSTVVGTFRNVRTDMLQLL